MKNSLDSSSTGLRCSDHAIAFVLFLVSGASFEIAGAFYVADAVMYSMMPFFIWKSFLRKECKRAFVFLSVVTAIVLSFSLVDLSNDLDKSFVLKGFGRNLGFICSYWVAFGVCLEFGVRKAGYWFSALFLSIPLHAIVGGALYWADVVTVFKIYNGIWLPYVLCLWFCWGRFWIALVMICASFFTYIYCDFRTGSAVFLLIGLVVFLRAQIALLKPYLLLVLATSVLILGGGAYYARSSFSDVDAERDQRRRMSNEIRSEMVHFAMDQMRARPLTGYGSWQHVMLFQSESSVSTQTRAQGVHNFMLQFGFEYGVIGIIFSVLYLYLLVYSLCNLVRMIHFGRWGRPDLMVFCVLFPLAFGLSSFFFGGLMGTARFVVGFTFACAAWTYAMKAPRHKFINCKRG